MESQEISLLLGGFVSLSELNCAGAEKLKEVISHPSPSPPPVETGWECVEWVVRCLCEYVRANVSGPPVLQELTKEHKAAQIDEAKKLSLAGDVPTSQMRRVECLVLAKTILVNRRKDLLVSFPSVSWWSLRFLQLWAQVLSEPHEELKSHILKVIDEFQVSTMFQSGLFPDELKCLFWLEAAQALVENFEFDRATKALESAVELAGLDLEMSGALGKRTKFQEKNLAQLLMSVGRHSSPLELRGSGSGGVPTNCLLTDDTLLENVQFKDEKDVGEAEQRLNPLEQAILLTSILINMKTYARTELMDEELRTEITKLLDNPLNWSIQTTTLFLRCKVELNVYRRLERSLGQSEELANQFSRLTPSFSQRMSSLCFSVKTPPIWEVRALHAQLLIKLGCVQEALGIYEKLERWDEVIQCYKQLGKLEQAEHIVRERLAEKEEPVMYCYLGDITMNPEHFEKAWELSNHRSARAQRSLGFLWMHRKQYEQAKECFNTSLKIETLQLRTWHNLGYCCMQLKHYEDAAQAYHRCCNIEPDNFEAWNNLSAAYIHLKKKEKAHKILEEALKFNYENWKVWENFLLVSVDTGNFRDCIRAFHRLLDLRDKHSDSEVLHILVGVAREESSFGDEIQTNSYRTEMKKLMGRVTSKISNDTQIWRAYADLCEPFLTSETPIDDYDKYIRLLQKAHQAAFQDKSWENSVDKCDDMMEYALKLANAQIKCAQLKNDDTVIQLKGSARLMLKSVVAGLKKRYVGIDGVITEEKLVNKLEKLEQLVDELSRN